MISTIGVGEYPYGVAVTNDNAYVANSGSGTVSIIGTPENPIVGQANSNYAYVYVGGEPFGIAVTPDNEYVYVSTGINVDIIWTYTDTVVMQLVPAASDQTMVPWTVINGLNGPWGIAVSPDSQWVYITNYYGNTVSEIGTPENTAYANQLVNTYSVGDAPIGVAITPNGDYAYVTNSGGSSVSVIYTVANTVTATIPVGYEPYDVAATNGFAYVTNVGSSTVSVINPVTLLETLPSSFYAPWGVTLTPSGDYAFVTSGSYDSVSGINTASRTVVSTISLPSGSGPYSVAVTPDGKYIYVTNQQSDTVSVINPLATADFGVSVASPTLTAGVSSPVTVKALNAYGAVDTSYRGTVTFSAGYFEAGDVLPSDYPFTATDAGVHTFTPGVTLLTEGSNAIYVTDTSDSLITGEEAVTVNPGSNLAGSNFAGHNFKGANLGGAILTDANLAGANLMGANLAGANLMGANLAGANLMGANLAGTILSGANFQGANLKGDNLQSAILSGANFQGANLQGDNLQSAILSGANFQGANLMNVDLTGATLTGISSSQPTNFNGANMKNAIFTDTICASPNYITASGTNTSGAVNIPANAIPPL